MSDSSDTLLLACDGGGSRCRVALGTVSNGILGTAEGGPANPNTNLDLTVRNIMQTSITAAEKAGLVASDLDSAHAHLGLAGILTEADSQQVADALPFACMTVTDDRITSLTGALGTSDGSLAAIGTGSFVGRQHAGSATLLGGWGFPVGDQASGAWLARKALECVLECHDGVKSPSPMTTRIFAEFENSAHKICAFSFSASPRDYARIAPIVVEAARAGDPHASRMMQAGADYITAALSALGHQPGDALCFSGGLGPHYADWLPQELQSNIRRAAGTALDGAFQLARATVPKIKAGNA